MTSEQKKTIEAAVRVGCSAADVHLTCSYPECKCKQLPTAVKAALSAATQRIEWLVRRNEDLEAAVTACERAKS